MRERRNRGWPILMLVAVVGCDAAGPADLVERRFDFLLGDQGWVAGFADYPVGGEEAMALVVDRRPLPEELDEQGEAVYIAGLNTSDDLFMFLKRRIDGLEPDRAYRLTIRIEMATNAPTGCPGIGGAPGESVYVKAGGAPVEPVPDVVAEAGTDLWRMNVDKGQQAAGGEHARVIGDVANGLTDCLDTPYRRKEVRGSDIPVTSGADGSLWLLVGTDSGFEGLTALYYLAIDVVLEW
ncbi:MAG: hypothetical protein GWN71_18495 [Gammaproteobacteria bacterium]|nr:hypothetical protein [Gemmatimonadota bacterium]NIU75488.1 hypothetical protein [Gammaproteobacteria bacterium]